MKLAPVGMALVLLTGAQRSAWGETPSQILFVDAPRPVLAGAGGSRVLELDSAPGPQGGVIVKGSPGGAAPSNARWPQFRGPNGSGICEECRPPVRFGPGLNKLWKTSLPPGHSSPVVWGNHIFLTAVEDGRLWTICLARANGQERWRRPAPAQALEKVHAFSSPAASTPATDGERVYAYFGSFGVLAYDLEGREVWRVPLATPPTQYGTASSPIVRGGTVILQRDGSSAASEVLALDGRTGRVAWTAPRPTLGESFSTPMLWARTGAEELIVVGNGRVVAYDPENGRENWWAAGVTFAPVAVAVSGEGLLFVSSSGAGSPQDPIDIPTWHDLLRDYDANGDGRLAVGEVPESVGIHLRKEVPREVPGNFLPLPRVLSMADQDGDGVCTKAEWDGLGAFLAANENNVMALRPGGRGNSTATHLAWKAQRGISEMPSPLAYRGRLWFVRNGGMVTSYEAATGRVILDHQRLGAEGQYVASPVAAGGRIFAASETGTITVFTAGDTLEVLARNELGERITATPAIAADLLYVRTEGGLWAFRSPP